MIIDGKKIAETLRQKLKKEIIEIKSSFKSVPGLTVILIGEDPASKIYVKNKEKFSKEIGINSEVIKYPENIGEKEVLNKNYTIVNSLLVGTSERPEVNIDWRVYTKNPDNPLIRDLIIEGLSLARTQKEEFASILNSNNGDVQALFETLEKFSKN